MRIWVTLALVGCSGVCGGDDAPSTCVEPTLAPEYYVEQAHKYFNTMDYNEDMDDGPEYSELVARWEWPPWLKLTAYTEENILATDAMLRLYPSVIPERECLFFETQPFARCKVVFYYDDSAHEGRGCPIYEEFVFNETGEMTWVEAWSDVDGLRPFDPDADPWAEDEDFDRLSSRIPGLGKPDGRIDLNGEAMNSAASTDEDVADFQVRANDWLDTWLAEQEAAGDTMWTTGCGWTD
jgi:hypothetical protein